MSEDNDHVSPRRALLIFFAVAVLAVGAVVYAVNVDPERIGGTVDTANLPVYAESVPGPARADGWINSDPLSLDDLGGKVVVYDFWTYSCVNCVRTLPYLRAWYSRYEGDGLEIIGVHSPEFEFEKDVGNVEAAVEDLEVTWPVALDPDHRIWDSFANQYWPAKYVTDREGKLRYVHFGEGAYDETEDVLRSLLGVPDDAPRADTSEEDGGSSRRSPELYLGSLRNIAQVPADGDIPKDKFALTGEWEVADEYAEAREAGAAIVLHFEGDEVNLVMDADEPVDVRLELDGEALDGVRVDGARLYVLAAGIEQGEHFLRVEAGDAGLQAFAFTFGSG